MKYIMLILILFYSCKHEEKEIGKSENYILTEKKISDNCNTFQMFFKEGKYIFTFSLSGKCSGFQMKDYIIEYSNFLNSNTRNIKNRKGYIVLNFYNFDYDDTFGNSITSITSKIFHSSVQIHEVDKEQLILKVK